MGMCKCVECGHEQLVRPSSDPKEYNRLPPCFVCLGELKSVHYTEGFKTPKIELAPAYNIPEGLMDEVAKIAYTAMVAELGTNCANFTENKFKQAAANVAKVSYLFAKEFMAERHRQYEQDCVLRVENITGPKDL